MTGRGIKREMITRERERVHTSDFGKLLGEGRFEFTLRYTICTFDRFKPAAGDEATHRDKTRCVLGVCPWTLCIARTGAVVFRVRRPSLALSSRYEGTYHTHVLQILYDLPRGRLHTHTRGILHGICVDTSDQRSERRTPSV